MPDLNQAESVSAAAAADICPDRRGIVSRRSGALPEIVEVLADEAMIPDDLLSGSEGQEMVDKVHIQLASQGMAARVMRPAAHLDAMVVRVPARSQLFEQSAEVTSTFEILDGAVMLSRLMLDGRRQIVDILGPERLFGHAISAVPEVAAETLTACELRVSGAEHVVSLDRVNSELRLTLDRLQAHAVLLGRKTALERVASGLVELAWLLAGPVGVDGDLPVSYRLPLTRADLADWLGLVLETISRNLSQLQRAGLITIERQDRIHIRDMTGLKRVAAYEPHHH
jgi:CRP/FNR family transcriptional regulator